LNHVNARNVYNYTKIGLQININYKLASTTVLTQLTCV